MREKEFILWLLLVCLGTSLARADVSNVVVNNVSPAVVNCPAQYTITFSDSHFAVGDGMIIAFPTGTIIPDIIPPGQITVNSTPTSFDTVNDPTNRYIILFSPAGADPIFHLVHVVINKGTNSIFNPDQAGSTFGVKVITTLSPTGVDSSPYSIDMSGNALEAYRVTVSPDVLGNNAGYNVSLITSSDGYLRAEASKIHLCFPGSTQVPSGSLPTTSLTVDGIQVHAAEGIGNTLSVTVDQWINGFADIAVVIPASLGLINPVTARPDYRLIVSTSTQPVTNPSAAYTINSCSTPLAVGNAGVSPDMAGVAGAYTFTFNTSPEGLLLGGVSKIFVYFPDTCVVSSGPLSTDGVLVNGQQAIWVSGAGNTVNVTIFQNISGGTSGISLVLPESLGILNPSVPGSDYHLLVSTSNQTNPGESSAFVITSPPTPTITPTATVSPTCTFTPTVTVTPTVTSTSTITGTITPDNLLAAIDLGNKPFLAFPNPARDKVIVVLHTQQAGDLKVVIYNLAGERVAVLHKRLGSGNGQSVVWDCHGMAPGIYIAHLLLDGKILGKQKVAITR